MKDGVEWVKKGMNLRTHEIEQELPISENKNKVYEIEKEYLIRKFPETVTAGGSRCAQPAFAAVSYFLWPGSVKLSIIQ